MSSETYAVRYRNIHGTVTTRHVTANKPEQAAKKVNGKARFVIGVKKVRKEDVIGIVATKKLIEEVCRKMPMKQIGVLEEDTTLDSIVFNQKFQMDEVKEKKKAEEPLWYKKNKKESE